MLDINLSLGGCDNRNCTLVPVIVSTFGLGLGLAGVRSSAHTARVKRRHSLFNRASTNTTDLFEIATILVEGSFEMCTTGFFSVVVASFVLVVVRIFVASLLALEGSDSFDTFLYGRE